MVHFINIDYDAYIAKYKEKRIICIGIGAVFHEFFFRQYEKRMLLKQVSFLLDNNTELHEKNFQMGDHEVSVESLNDFAGRHNQLDMSEYVLALFARRNRVSELLSVVDHIAKFDGMACLFGERMILWGWEWFHPPYPPMPSLPQTDGAYQIPKRIHYCWFGENELSPLNQMCIRSWQSYCPDYELILWNEENYDIAQAPRYVREAYELGKYAFVSDYVRLDVVYRYGGIYLDTDVELFSSLDSLLGYRMWFSFMEYGEVASGLGFGAICGTSELYEHKKMYEKMRFVLENGNLNLTLCPRYSNDFFRWSGIRLDNSLQYVDDMLFLPSSYFCPLVPTESNDGNWNLALLSLSEHTMGLHHCANTWKEAEELAEFDNTRMELLEINQRLLYDWKATREKAE